MPVSATITKAVKYIGIIAEYNPFHNGHYYLINQIKKIIPDSAVISLMSGNLVQRGEFALFSKYERAKSAALNGSDAVLELPPVYSCAPANIFAESAVNILHNLTGIDYLCFGSESGDLDLLNAAADKISGKNFGEKVREYIKSNRNVSYSQSIAKVFAGLYGEENAAVFSGSNNILALEYLKALKKLKSGIIPVTIKRLEDENSAVGASYIRERLNSPEELKKYMPETAYNIFADSVKSGKCADINRISSAVISYIRRLSLKDISKFAETGGGEEYRIKKAAEKAVDYKSLVSDLQAKHASESYVKRMILNVFFGITREMQKQSPEYAALLAANGKGREFLKSIRKTSRIKILTNPVQAAENLFIDGVYKLALSNPDGEIHAYQEKPYIF